MDETCENCRYYLPVKTGYKEDGTCRFYPPTVSAVSEDAMAIWPRVKRTDWCGKYAPKKNKKNS